MQYVTRRLYGRWAESLARDFGGETLKSGRYCSIKPGATKTTTLNNLKSIFKIKIEVIFIFVQGDIVTLFRTCREL